MAAYNATAPPAAPALVRRWLEAAAKEGPGVVVVSLGRMPRVEGWQAHALVRGLQPDKAGNESAWRVLWASPAGLPIHAMAKLCCDDARAAQPRSKKSGKLV